MKQISKSVSPMSNEGRNSYVIDHLTDACLELLQTRPLSDISISELCDNAGVGRASFYRNFNTKEDILMRYIRQLFSGWINEYESSGGQSLSRLIGLLFSHFEAHQTFYEILNKRKLIYLLKDMLLELSGPEPEQTKEEAYAKAFVSYTLYGWIEVWFQRGMKESAEEMTQLLQNQGL